MVSTGTSVRSEPEQVEVCVCTFHRPEVVETLRSIAAQTLAPRRIIVVDNAVEPEAADRVAAAARDLGVAISYVHAPARNISLARNAALDAATAEWIAFLDDDETAAPGWLDALLAKGRAEGLDAVLGPVDAVYGPEAPAWQKAMDLHSTRPVVSGGEIRKGYAGNVLLRRASIEFRGLRFDLALGRTGGEDDCFFHALTDSGGRIGFAQDALAWEPVPQGRTRLSWLLRRSFRGGQTHGTRLASGRGGGGRLAQAALAAAKAAACLVAMTASLGSPARRGGWLLRAALHLGVVARLAGRRELELY